MDLIPKVLVAGVFTPPTNVPGGPQVSIDKINRIWAEASPKYRYRQFQMAPDASSAQFIGASDDETVIIQPPLLQIRDAIELDSARSAEKAEDVLKIIARNLGVNQFFNFAVRHIAWAPAPERDGRGFVLHRLVGKTENDLVELVGGGSIWAGVKFVVQQNGAQYTLTVEPLQRDESFIFLDLDAQFPGQLDNLDVVTTRAGEAFSYMRQAVAQYLDKH